MSKTFTLKYFAQLQEQASCSGETFSSDADTPDELYRELRETHGFDISRENLRVVVNDRFASWDEELIDGDEIVFLPPFAGG